MKLLFVRHGETAVNVKNLTHHTGDDSGLTELGKKQAAEAAGICRENKVETVFSSPEKRALETARIVAGSLGVQMEAFEGLRERNWGEWEGKPWAEIKAVLDPMDIESRYAFVPPGGESWKEMEARLKDSLDYITGLDYDAVAVVTHEGALRGLMPLLKNQSKETSLGYSFPNAVVLKFEYKNSKFVEMH